ncbi:MAG: Fe-S cluster assembly protein SufD [Lentisphaeraceae bacterium]|nr:Fe-S cluster assembly protein SufD [Lentisphaeraceae bacterium]
MKSKKSIDAADFLSSLSAISGNSAVQELRASALATLQSGGFPTQKVEAWKYTNIQKLLKENFSLAASAGKIEVPLLENAYSIVLVDGHFSAALSNLENLPKGIEVKSINEALQSDAAIAKKINTPQEDNSYAFDQLNAALFSDGAFIKIGRNAVCDKIIHIINIATSDNTAAIARHLFIAESGSQVEILEDYISTDGQVVFSSAVTDVHVAKNATVKHVKNQSQNDKSFHISSVHISQERDSNYQSTVLACGSQTSRTNVEAQLNDENASVVLNGLYAVRGSQLCDNHSVINHNAAYTFSQQLYKGILDDRSRAVFNGKVFIARDSQKVDSNQMNRNLMLSDKARVDTKPELEVYADDVKAAHGAAIGQLNDEELFYIQSRCISKEAALAMLVHGFMEEIVDGVSSDVIKAYLQKIYLGLFDH